jgi:hypothetical protein
MEELPMASTTARKPAADGVAIFVSEVRHYRTGKIIRPKTAKAFRIVIKRKKK